MQKSALKLVSLSLGLLLIVSCGGRNQVTDLEGQIATFQNQVSTLQSANTGYYTRS